MSVWKITVRPWDDLMGLKNWLVFAFQLIKVCSEFYVLLEVFRGIEKKNQVIQQVFKENAQLLIDFPEQFLISVDRWTVAGAA